MSAEPPVYILDSYAMLAYVGKELGGDQVRTILEQSLQGKCNAMLSVINLGEVLYITERIAGLNKAQAVLAAIEQLPIKILPADQPTVLAAAHIKANYRLSYADAFAVAAAQGSNGILVTGDPEFLAVEQIVRIQWLEK
jgi:predicted nucleic acid-binding protein